MGFRQAVTANWKPVLAMVLLPQTMAELLIGFQTPAGFFSPTTVIFFILVGYGVPVLLIRECAVRCGLGVAGMFMLGIVYGLYNEGLLAKTITNPAGQPDVAYTGYSILFGMNMVWIPVIGAYHALSSVLFPILIVHSRFSERSKDPWLGKRTAIITGVLLFLVGCVGFFNKQNGAGTVFQFAFLMALAAVLAACGLRLKKGMGERAVRRDAKPIYIGVGASLAFMVCSALAKEKVPVPVFVVVLATMAGGIFYGMTRPRYSNFSSLKLFAAGYYAMWAFLGVVVGFERQDFILGPILGFVFIALMTLWAKRVLREAPQN